MIFIHKYWYFNINVHFLGKETLLDEDNHKQEILSLLPETGSNAVVSR